MMHNNPSTFLQSTAATRDENYATIAIPKLLYCSFSSKPKTHRRLKLSGVIQIVWHDKKNSMAFFCVLQLKWLNASLSQCLAVIISSANGKEIFKQHLLLFGSVTEDEDWTFFGITMGKILLPSFSCASF